MNAFRKLVFAFSVTVLLASPALAQQRQGGFRGGRGMGGGLFLLMNPSVQKELDLKEEQVEKVRTTLQEIREKHGDEMRSLQDLQGDERREKMQSILATMEKESKEGLAKVLTEEQSKRYEQIVLQQRGIEALTDPVVQKALSLNDDQTQKIDQIQQDLMEKSRELLQGAQGNFREVMPKVMAARREAFTKAADVLTAEQKETWKKMIGEPFEIQFQGRGGDNA